MIFLKSKKSNWPHLTIPCSSHSKWNRVRKTTLYDNDYNKVNYKYISLPEDLQIQILIFPTMSPDSETSETPQTETTEPTQPEPQTLDQTDPNPPERNSVTSKVRTLRSVQKTSKIHYCQAPSIMCMVKKTSSLFCFAGQCGLCG